MYLPVTHHSPIWILNSQLAAKKATLGEARYAASKYDRAAKLYASTILGGDYSDFLTTLCYDDICTLVR